MPRRSHRLYEDPEPGYAPSTYGPRQPGTWKVADFDAAPPDAQALILAAFRRGEDVHAQRCLVAHLAYLADVEAIRERLQAEAAIERHAR